MLLNDLLSDIQYQQKWRSESDKCYLYYDGIQQDQNSINSFKEIGKTFYSQNHIKAIINAVLGNEVQTRTDWIVKGDDEHNQSIEAVNEKLNEVMRVCEGNIKLSNAYFDQVVGGIGWIKVCENNKIGNTYVLENIDRQDIYYDMRSKDDLLQDARWITRRKVMDKDEAISLFPEHKDIIEQQINGFTEWDKQGEEETSWYSQYSSVKDKSQIVDGSRQRIVIYEVYYKKPEIKKIIENDGIQLEFDPNNERHLLHQHKFGSKTKIFNQMRKVWFIGAIKVKESKTDLPHNDFPFIPVCGYTRNDTRTKYGLVKDMIPPQDKYNLASSNINHILRSKQIIKDKDATPDMTDQDISREVNRIDGIINKERGSEFIIQQNWNELQHHNVLLEQAENDLRTVSGVYQSFSGKGNVHQSGVAISSLAQLGSQGLATINSNYQRARKKVGELVLSHILYDIGDKPISVSVAQDLGKNKKTVVLNSFDEEGKPLNVLADIRMDIVMSSIKTTDGYREQKLAMMTELFKVLDEQSRADMLPILIEEMNTPKKEIILNKMYERSGANMTEEQKQAQAEQQTKEIQLKFAEREAEVQEKQAQALERKAQAERNLADAEYKKEQTNQLRETKKDNSKKLGVINSL